MTQPAPPPIRRELPATPEFVMAVLAGLVRQYGEPLVDPQRIQYSVARSLVEAGAGHRLKFEFITDELNPFGRVDIILEEQA